MKKRLLALFIMLSLAATFVFPAFAEETLQGSGTSGSPFTVSDAEELKDKLGSNYLSNDFFNDENDTIYIKLKADIDLTLETLASAPTYDEKGNVTTYGYAYSLNFTDKTINLDLNGHNITSNIKGADIFKLVEGNTTLNINNNAGTEATISGPEGAYVLNIKGNCTYVHAEDDIAPTVNVGKGVKISTEGNRALGAYVGGNKATLNVSGTIESENSFAICGNGSYSGNTHNGDTVININDGAVVTSKNGPAIYHPQVGGKLYVSGGTITGATGIEIRSGELNVTGGIIEGTADPYASTGNGNGSTTDGAGIAVSPHTTDQALKVTVSNGEIKGFNAFAAVNPNFRGEDAMGKVVLALNGGKFTGHATKGYDVLAIGGNKVDVTDAATLTTSRVCTKGLERQTDDDEWTTTCGKVNLPENAEGFTIVPENGNVTIKYDKDNVEVKVELNINDEGNYMSFKDVEIDTTHTGIIAAVKEAILTSAVSKVCDIPVAETEEADFISSLRETNPTLNFYKTLGGSITASTN